MAIIGIDLGTTNSLAAVWKDGACQLIPNASGAFLTPSAVSVDEDGSILVGRAAKESQEDMDKLASYFSTVVREKARREGGAWTRYYQARGQLK